MGGDHAPEEIVLGACEAAKQHPDARILLVGQRDRLTRADLPPNVEIVHASQLVEMKEEPVKALVSKRDSSLRVAMTLVKQGAPTPSSPRATPSRWWPARSSSSSGWETWKASSGRGSPSRCPSRAAPAP